MNSTTVSFSKIGVLMYQSLSISSLSTNRAQNIWFLNRYKGAQTNLQGKTVFEILVSHRRISSFFKSWNADFGSCEADDGVIVDECVSLGNLFDSNLVGVAVRDSTPLSDEQATSLFIILNNLSGFQKLMDNYAVLK